MKPLLRVIGDVHGRYEPYIQACHLAERSVQVGDLMRDYAEHDVYQNSGLIPEYHQFFSGNHDNMDAIENCPHNLGDFGYFDILDVGRVFWVRGAFSLDWRNRSEVPRQVMIDGNLITLGRDIWKEREQLTQREGREAMALYEKVKPDILLSHECPYFFLSEVTNPEVTKRFGYDEPLIRTTTNMLLDSMYDLHRPKYHLFGHYHHWKSKKVDGTTLVCIPIMGAVDFYKDEVVPVNIADDRFAHEIANVVI